MVENDEHPQPVESPDLPDLIMFDDHGHHGHTEAGDEIIPEADLLDAAELDVVDLDQETDWFALLAGVDPQPEIDGAAPPRSNFLCNTEQEFLSLYHNDVVSEPCAPAPQLEEHTAGLVQTITSDQQMDASSGVEEGAQQEPEAIYGLPSCPAFSPEMIRRCSDDVMMPWPLSPTSTAMFWS